jgi:6-phosphofructokinase
MDKIAILTRDCAGINASIRSVVRTAFYHNIEVIEADQQPH